MNARREPDFTPTESSLPSAADLKGARKVARWLVGRKAALLAGTLAAAAAGGGGWAVGSNGATKADVSQAQAVAEARYATQADVARLEAKVDAIREDVASIRSYMYTLMSE